MLKIFKRKTKKATITKTAEPTIKKWVSPLEVEKLSDNFDKPLFNYKPWQQEDWTGKLYAMN